MHFTVTSICLSLNHVLTMLLHECSEYIAPERTQLAAAAQNIADQLELTLKLAKLFVVLVNSFGTIVV